LVRKIIIIIIMMPHPILAGGFLLMHARRGQSLNLVVTLAPSFSLILFHTFVAW